MKRILYDHWKIFLAFLLAAGGATLLYNLWSYIVSFINWQYSGWIIAGAVSVSGLLYILYKARSKPSASIAFISTRPAYKHMEIKDPVFLYGVNWHFWRGGNLPWSDSGDDDDYRGWVDGPFCSVCDYELDRDYKKHKWTCVNGHKAVNVPKSLQEDTLEKVIKVLEAEYRKQKREGKLK